MLARSLNPMIRTPTQLGPDDAPALLAALASARCGSDRTTVIAIDGLTGSGKTHLATELADRLARIGTQVSTLAIEDLVPGWDGLADGVARARRGVETVMGGDTATLLTWDWVAMAPGPMRALAPVPGGILVVEGCGALAAVAGISALRVRVEAPDDVRRARLAVRDPYSWDVAAWETQERSVARSWMGASGRADPLDAVVDTTV